jgi:hypothetical protein
LEELKSGKHCKSFWGESLYCLFLSIFVINRNRAGKLTNKLAYEKTPEPNSFVSTEGPVALRVKSVIIPEQEIFTDTQHKAYSRAHNT